MTPSPRASLLARLVAVGLAQLLAFAVVSLVVGYLTLRPSVFERHHRRLSKADLVRLASHLDDRRDLAADVEAILATDELEVTVFDSEGRVLASNVSPPLSPSREFEPPRGPDRVHGPDHGPHGPDREHGPHDGFGPPPGPPPHRFLAPIFPPEPPLHSVHYELVGATSRGSVASRVTPDPWRFLPALLTFLGSVVVVTIGSFLLARSIADPLRELARTARRFGSGDLRSRVGFARADEIGEVGRAFDEMAERIEQLVRTEKELLANVSHELRTPLSRIRVALDLASEGDAGTARESLAEIAVDLAELEELVEDVLVATRLSMADASAGSVSLVRSLVPCEANAIAERAAEKFRALHRDRPFSIAPSEGPCEILGDAALLRRVLDNLLENASKYSPDPTTPIRLAVTRGDRDVRFEVQDRGIGIAADDLPFVFEPFFRADRSRTRTTGGVGLGLTLAKRIVEAHGGVIRVSSERDAGTRVTIELPLRSNVS